MGNESRKHDKISVSPTGKTKSHGMFFYNTISPTANSA